MKQSVGGFESRMDVLGWMLCISKSFLWVSVDGYKELTGRWLMLVVAMEASDRMLAKLRQQSCCDFIVN